VVGEIEKGDVVVIADGRDDVGADEQAAVERADGSFRQGLGAGGGGQHHDHEQPELAKPHQSRQKQEATIIIVRMATPEHPIFSLEEARALLPHVKHVTADAVRQAESLASQLHNLAEDDPEHATLSAALRDVVNGWAEELRSLGLEAKGLWLVDF